MTTTDRAPAGPAAVGAGPSAGPGPDEGGPGAPPAPLHAVRTYGLATAGYLALALVVWWNVWSQHPTSTTTCGCGDTSLFTWFLAWPAYAIAHGLDPLYSTAMFHPHGVNLLSNTAVAGAGVVLAPVTWLFGPIASLNVALTLSPVLSALAMFALLRRFVAWSPAAFAGGLLYGFSPFVLISLTDAHLMLGMAPVPPLMVACLDEILVRQRRRAVPSGVVLGVLVAAQFFVGSEALVITLIAAGIGVVLLVGLALVRRRRLLRERVGHAATGLGAAATSAAVLLAYPVWFALAGPAHLAGPVWGPGSLISYGGTDLRYFLRPAPVSPNSLAHRLFGGYQGPSLSAQYFGIGLVAVVVVGLVVWRRDLRLWLFAAVGAVSVPLSLGLAFHHWTPWRLFVRLPLMDNVIPSRFLVVTYLCAAVLLGLVVDHTRGAIDRRVAGEPRPRRAGGDGPWRRWAGASAGVVVAAIALVPLGAYFTDGLPLTTQAVVLPPWFRTVAPRLEGRQVLLAFPVPFALLQSAMTWQAVDDMHYDMPGGGGPGSLLARAGPEREGQRDLGNLSISQSPQTITAEEITAVRKTLDGWGVTTVVIPDPAHLPLYERLHLVRTTALLITAATGQRPVRQADAWVWTGVDHAGAPLAPSAATLARCGAGPAVGSAASIDQAISCVVAGTPAP